MASELLTTDQPSSSHEDFIPPLEPGDRLTRAEFERRYEAMPHVKKAELIEGIVYMPSPVRLKRHARPHSDVIGWLYMYKAATLGVKTADNASVRLDMDLDMDNEPQPDTVLYIEPEYGGQIRISDDDYIKFGPELVVEVASSSVSYDLGEKMNAYRRNGVTEYVVWRVLDKAIDWFILRDEVYKPQQPDNDGVVTSNVFPGLRLNVPAMLSRNHAQVVQTLQTGLNNPQHQDFVARLSAQQVR